MPTKRSLQMRLLRSYSLCALVLCQPLNCSILEFPSAVYGSLSVVSTTHQCWWHAFLHCRLRTFVSRIGASELSTSLSCLTVRLAWFFCSWAETGSWECEWQCGLVFSNLSRGWLLLVFASMTIHSFCWRASRTQSWLLQLDARSFAVLLPSSWWSNVASSWNPWPNHIQLTPWRWRVQRSLYRFWISMLRASLCVSALLNSAASIIFVYA